MLRHVAELDGRWVAVLGFGSPTRIQQIFNRGGDYILTVKGNMPSLEPRTFDEDRSQVRTGSSPQFLAHRPQHRDEPAAA